MSFQDQLNEINQSINSFFSFIGNKLSNYKNLSLGEQIAYPAAIIGLLLIFVSIVMFLLF